MNIWEREILKKIKSEAFINQRILAEATGLSLGKVNRSLKELQVEGFLTEENSLTARAKREFAINKPKNAIILAAGYGMRMVPINIEMPKGMLTMHGEVMIERQIRQLHEAGIKNITVIVGYMKESYEYLIDQYGVELLVNSEYGAKNNLHSLRLAANKIENTYILPCDVWCEENPFCDTELYSWYMVTELVENESEVRVNRKRELVKASGGNQMIGIAYIAKEQAKIVRKRLVEYDTDIRYAQCFWEKVLFEKEKMLLAARVEASENVYEINTYEQLRELDAGAPALRTELLALIADVLNAKEEEIVDICVLKKGMTNRSFLFTCRGMKYIMRIPGEGTEQLINRKQECAVYSVIKEEQICDDICYINPENGYKMTRYIEQARVCDPMNPVDVRKCMKCLRKLHEKRLQVGHTFDLFGQIAYYESLWNGESSCYRDFDITKEHVYELKEYIDSQPKVWGLTHIDAVPDNFLIYENTSGKEEIRLIDWEYAGMQDVHVDIAMFAIYAMYDRDKVDELIDAYFTEGCEKEVRRKIYAYIAVCGILWSNWCEYKRQLGVEFGEYSLRQYRYAKDYYRVWKEIKENA